MIPYVNRTEEKAWGVGVCVFDQVEFEEPKLLGYWVTGIGSRDGIKFLAKNNQLPYRSKYESVLVIWIIKMLLWIVVVIAISNAV